MSLSSLIVVIVILSLLEQSDSYRFGPRTALLTNRLSATWQEQVDEFVDVDTSCDARKDIANNLIKSLDSITNDVIQAIKDRDIEKIAPSTLTYGKNLKNAQAFRKQLLSDIIPDLITNQIPKLVTETPNIIKKVTSSPPDPSKLIKQGEEALNFARDLSQDPSLLQSTLDDARKEVKNIFKATPEGLYSPPYEVLKSTENFEIRKYSSYSVASTSIESSSSSSADVDTDILATGNSFNELAGYILSGENEKSEKLSMTTPVIMTSGRMDFILPDKLNKETAPKPKSSKITIEDVEGEIVAVRTFPGIPTEKEVAKQRATLEDALLADGLIYDNLSFKTLTYNPPYTLPWLRRNEVSLKVEYKSSVDDQ